MKKINKMARVALSSVTAIVLTLSLSAVTLAAEEEVNDAIDTSEVLTEDTSTNDGVFEGDSDEDTDTEVLDNEVTTIPEETEVLITGEGEEDWVNTAETLDAETTSIETDIQPPNPSIEGHTLEEDGGAFLEAKMNNGATEYVGRWSREGDSWKFQSFENETAESTELFNAENVEEIVPVYNENGELVDQTVPQTGGTNMTMYVAALIASTALGIFLAVAYKKNNK